ncbi:hypothetical protein EYF80_033409 [Liparis tanakae]|uniref:Uncharacterized protein n=1 Tax=Liparis tanakae TaxID=230148 RepID=A0A4Z2GUF2_9TELE|nr:hypothetical protein EYF80_033409 [Liparis tanakae]
MVISGNCRFKQKLGDCGPQAPGGLLIPFQLDNNLSGRWPPRGCKPRPKQKVPQSVNRVFQQRRFRFVSR